jgi:hypothetical protein
MSIVEFGSLQRIKFPVEEIISDCSSLINVITPERSNLIDLSDLVEAAKIRHQTPREYIRNNKHWLVEKENYLEVVNKLGRVVK